MSEKEYSLDILGHGVCDNGKAYRATLKMIDGGGQWDVTVNLRRNDNDTIKGRFKMEVSMKDPSIENSGARYIYYVYDDLDHQREDIMYRDVFGGRLKAKWLECLEHLVYNAKACGL